MGYILEGLFALGLLLVLFWVWSLRRSLLRDRADAEKVRAQAEKVRAEAEREARLHRKGERLRCLSCEKTFRGPLTEDGCPRCHLASFVVSDAEYQETMAKENIIKVKKQP